MTKKTPQCYTLDELWDIANQYGTVSVYGYNNSHKKRGKITKEYNVRIECIVNNDYSFEAKSEAKSEGYKSSIKVCLFEAIQKAETLIENTQHMQRFKKLGEE